MMYLVQGQENTPYLLVFNAVGRPNLSVEIDDGGKLFDPYEVKFQIRDPSGSDIFPGSGSYEDVTATAGRLGTGRFYAYDDAFDIGWTPSATAALGTYTIEWRWTEESGDAEQRWVQKFQVESSSKFNGFPYATYISPAQVRLDITDEELSDARLEANIELAQQIVERMTRNLFRPVYMEMVLNGQHHESIFLQYPIVGIEGIFSNNDVAELTRQAYGVAFERTDQLHKFSPNPDNRRNPSIRWRGRGTSIYSGGTDRLRSRFNRGINNQVIKGVFGFVESDGSVPTLIQNAMLRLISLNADPIAAGSAGAAAAGPISSETVDRHSISYAVTKTAQAKTKWALAGSKEVEEILAMYKAPIAMNAPVPTHVWNDGGL